MKKIVLVLLAMIMVTVSCAVCVSAEETVTPTNYWDFVESFPEQSNLDIFKTDGEFTYSKDGHIVFTAPDGDGDRDHIQIFINAEDKGGTSMRDNDVVVARFRVDDNTFTKDYEANFGYIGYNPSQGNETYVAPRYVNTYDWQVMYFDCQDDTWSVDSWYIVWFWFKAARFQMEIEVDYIATFADMDSAKAYVAARGHDTEPTIITEETTEAPPSSDTTSGNDSPVAQHTAAQNTSSGADTTAANDATTEAQEDDGGSSSAVYIIIGVAAAVIIAAVIVIIIKKKK